MIFYLERLKVYLLISFLFIVYNVYASKFYVSPEGNDANQGTFENPYKTIPRAISESVAGDTIFILKGTYIVTPTIQISSSKSGTEEHPFHLFAFPGDTVIIDFYLQAFGERGINLKANYWYIKGLAVKNAGDNGLYIEGENNIIENCVFCGNDDSGLQISGGGAYNTIINCDSYNNADPDNEDADGFAAKLDIGPGNEFHGCRAWNNSDDGWDLYESDDSVVIADCWTFRNGYLPNESPSIGNGNGFKVGGEFIAANHYVRNCISFDNRKYNYHQNNNTGKITIYNSLAWNGEQRNYNFYLEEAGPNLLINNISFNGNSGDRFTNCNMTTNSWQSIDADESDFLSLDRKLAKDNRPLSGDLPSNIFARLTVGSNLIDAGTDVGISYTGLAPDLGPMETISENAVYSLNLQIEGEGGVWISPPGGIYDADQEVTLIAWHGENFSFEAWSGDVNETNDTTLLFMDTDKFITANFSEVDNENKDSLRIEAEDMILNGFTFERISSASKGKVIRANSGSSFDNATYSFMGSEHNYRIKVRYLDQINGASAYRFYVNTELISIWEGDEATGSINLFIEKEIKNVLLTPDDIIKIEANQIGGEYGRVDCIDLVKSEYIPESLLQNDLTNNSNSLFQNYPNPALSSTRIDFYLFKGSDIVLEVFDIQNKNKTTLIKTWYSEGMHEYNLDCSTFKPGVYYYRLITNDGFYLKKLIIR